MSTDATAPPEPAPETPANMVEVSKAVPGAASADAYGVLRNRFVTLVPLPEHVSPFVGLSEEETFYALASLAPETRRGYESVWKDFTGWCATHPIEIDGAFVERVLVPANPETITNYIFNCVSRELKMGTVAHRLSAIRTAHEMKGYTSPTLSPRVQKVWEGVQRTHWAALNQAPPLMPPVLWDVLDLLPATAAGHRDAAILLVGFIGALRRSEIAKIDLADLADHPKGRVLTIPRSKTDQLGAGQLVALPHSEDRQHCPNVAIDRWLTHRGLEPGPLFRTVHYTGSVQAKGLTGRGVNEAIQRACVALNPDHGFSAHSLRAGLATYAAAMGATDLAIRQQTRHASAATLTKYIRHETVWDGNAVTMLGL